MAFTRETFAQFEGELLLNPRSHGPTVDQKIRSRDKVGFLRTEKQRGRGNILRGSPPTDKVSDKTVFRYCILPNRRADTVGGNGVHPDAISRELNSQRAGEVENARLRGGVGGGIGPPGMA